MKKVIAVLIAALSILFCFPVSAVENDLSLESAIFEEVNKLVDIEKYPVNPNDDGIYLLSLVEHGYTKGVWSSENALYLYFYNPSKKPIKETGLNTVQMADGWKEGNVPTSFRKYGIKVEGAALDGLYIRAKVNVPATSIVRMNNGDRIYGITEFELLEDAQIDIANATNAQSYAVGYVYSFSGSGETLSCELTSFLNLTLKVGRTSYLSGNSALGVGYSNQASSVYFSIPREIEEKYGLLYDVKYEYYKARSAPIFVTTDQEFYNELVKVVGKDVPESEWDSWPVQIVAGFEGILESDYYQMIYGRSVGVFDPNLNRIAVAFPTDKIEEGHVMVTSDALEEYFNSYESSFGYRNENTATYRGYSTDLFDFNAYEPYKVENKVTREEDFNLPSYGDTHDYWFDGLLDYGWFYNDDNYDGSFDDVPYIQSLSNADFEDEDFLQNYLVSSADLSEVKTYVESAERNDENTYILHFAIEDDYSMNVVPKFVNLINTNSYETYRFSPNVRAKYVNGDDFVFSEDVIFIQTDLYLDFDIISLGFSDDGKDITTFGVVMSPVDVFPDLEGIQIDKAPFPEIPKPDFGLILSVILVVALVLLVIFIIDRYDKYEQTDSLNKIQKHLSNQEEGQARQGPVFYQSASASGKKHNSPGRNRRTSYKRRRK